MTDCLPVSLIMERMKLDAGEKMDIGVKMLTDRCRGKIDRAAYRIRSVPPDLQISRKARCEISIAIGCCQKMVSLISLCFNTLLNCFIVNLFESKSQLCN